MRPSDKNFAVSVIGRVLILKRGIIGQNSGTASFRSSRTAVPDRRSQVPVAGEKVQISTLGLSISWLYTSFTWPV